MHEAGLSDSDLWWLVRRGYFKHAQQASEPSRVQRPLRGTGAIQFADSSSFVLTTSGIQFVERLLNCYASIGDKVNATLMMQRRIVASVDIHVPSFDRQRRELRIGQVIIKRFLAPAENQETILSAFEKEAWPARIDDPLPPAPEIDPKRRLHSAIQCLNRNQKAQLVHFHGGGCQAAWLRQTGAAETCGKAGNTVLYRRAA